MIVGYVMDIVLGLSLALVLLLTTHPNVESIPSAVAHSPMAPSPNNGTFDVIVSPQEVNCGKKSKKQTLAKSLKEAFTVYADAALFLGLSIQIAALAVLVQKDFGISATGLGGITVQVTWAVSLITMLPLMLLVALRSILLERPHLRFLIVCVCWAPFTYIFISRMIATYGPSQIGTGGAAVISPEDWAMIENICLSGVRTLNSSESKALDVFGVGGSLFISLIVLGKFFFCLPSQTPDQKEVRRASRLYAMFHNKRASGLIIFGVFVFGVSQIWAIIRLRVFERSMAQTVLTSFVDNQWTFGQVVAVIVFAPVFVELLYLRLNIEHTPSE